MGKQKALEDLEQDLWDFDVPDLASVIVNLFCVERIKAEEVAKKTDQLLWKHIESLNSIGADVVSIQPMLYYPALVNFLAFERPRDTELDRKVRNKQGVGLFLAREDHRSEFLHHLIHTDRKGNLSERPQTTQAAGLQVLEGIYEEVLGQAAPDPRNILETYRDFRLSVRISEGTLFRSYARDYLKNLKSYIPTPK